MSCDDDSKNGNKTLKNAENKNTLNLSHDNKLSDKHDGMKIIFSQRALFGGALSISIPDEWRDVSSVRPIPDHQEIYQDCTYSDHRGKSDQNTAKGSGGMLAVEIFDRQELIRDEDAAKFFWQDLADDNGENESEITLDVEEGGNGNVSKQSRVQFSELWMVGKGDHIQDGNENIIIENDSRVKISMPKLNYPVKACSCMGIQRIGLHKSATEKDRVKASRVIVELCVLRLEHVQTDLLITLTMPLFEGVKKNIRCHTRMFQKIMNSFYVEDWSLFV